ncbi:MAG: class I SAM-dependent methyltransferase [Thermoplasmata archaeon]
MPSRTPRTPPARTRESLSPTERFRTVDRYRADREWRRYEGTGQRDLFRELRERFLIRHAVDQGWVLDLGSGPGRFLPFAGRGGARRVALDLSREMLSLIPETWAASASVGPVPDRVLGNALCPPLELAQWSEVLAVGNTLGFAGDEAEKMLTQAENLVATGGSIVIEIAPGPGERSSYLARLPPTSVARILRAPVKAVLGRLDREPFRVEPVRRAAGGSFRRFSAIEIHDRWRNAGWELTETVAVAPCLGPDQRRIDAVKADEASWKHLLTLEEEVGRRPERWEQAAAVLLSARRAGSKRTIK